MKRENKKKIIKKYMMYSVHAGLFPRVSVTQLYVLTTAHLKSNVCACFIENSWKFRINVQNCFISNDLLRS